MLRWSFGREVDIIDYLSDSNHPIIVAGKVGASARVCRWAGRGMYRRDSEWESRCGGMRSVATSNASIQWTCFSGSVVWRSTIAGKGQA